MVFFIHNKLYLWSVWYALVGYGELRFGLAGHGMVWLFFKRDSNYRMYSKVWCGFVRFGRVRLGMAW